MLATVLSIATNADDKTLLFEIVFCIVWIGGAVIAVNGQNPRLDGSLVGMIKVFEGMFGQDFWKQVVVLFTRMPMDEKAKKKREKNSKQTAKEIISMRNNQLDEVDLLKRDKKHTTGGPMGMSYAKMAKTMVVTAENELVEAAPKESTPEA